MKRSKEYKRMMRKYRKEAKKITKEMGPWEFSWSIDFIINHLKWMKDYYTLGENVLAMEDKEWNHNEKYTRLEMVDQLLDAYYAFSDYEWPSLKDIEDEDERKRISNQSLQKYNNLRHDFYRLLEKNFEKLWD